MPSAENCPMKHSIISDSRRSGIKLWAVIFWLAAWQLLAMIVSQEILLASPVSVLKRLCALMLTGEFWKTLWFSLRRILGGFLLGGTAGMLSAALAARFRRMRELIAPFIALVRAIPVASFVIVALIWIPSRNLALLITTLIVWPVMYTNLLCGIEQTDQSLIEMADVFRIRPTRRLLFIYIPQVLPFLRTAIITSMGLAWKSGVAAEVIGISSGSIGERLYRAKIYLMTPDLFAWTLALIAASLICEKLFLLAVDAGMRRLERM